VHVSPTFIFKVFFFCLGEVVNESKDKRRMVDEEGDKNDVTIN